MGPCPSIYGIHHMREYQKNNNPMFTCESLRHIARILISMTRWVMSQCSRQWSRNNASRVALCELWTMVILPVCSYLFLNMSPEKSLIPIVSCLLSDIYIPRSSYWLDLVPTVCRWLLYNTKTLIHTCSCVAMPTTRLTWQLTIEMPITTVYTAGLLYSTQHDMFCKTLFDYLDFHIFSSTAVFYTHDYCSHLITGLQYSYH